MPAGADTSPACYLPRAGLSELTERLHQRGYQVIAPVVRDGAISMQPIGDAGEVAGGVRDEQDQGHYRLIEDDGALTFGFAVSADGAKRYLMPPVQQLIRFHVQGESFVMDEAPAAPPRLAFVGLRGCDLAAMAITDRVLGTDDPATLRCEAEAYYTQTRRGSFIVAVDCIHPAGTCFCASMGTGPRAEKGFDLALTELRDGFVMRIGSEQGAAVAAELPTRPPTDPELELAELKIQRATEQMGRRLDRRGLKEMLDQSVEHPHWDRIAERCLSCGNCTMVCPTCFCSSVTDVTDLAGNALTRTRQWESCFTHQFSYTTAGAVRNTTCGRYRHWLRHKHCTFQDQFGCGGCVGCGRCITWCPAGIDPTAELQALRNQPSEAHDERARERKR